MKARLLTLLTTLAFLGLCVSVPALAGKDKDCGGDDPHPSCGGGGGGDDHGDPPARYCAQLVSGGFDFATKTVTRNNRGNVYTSTETLSMDRPSGTQDRQAWDTVFETCPVLSSKLDPSSEPYPIEGLTMGDNWGISNSGGKQSGIPGSLVLVSFRDAYTDVYPEIEVDLHLVGDLPAPFPVGDNDIPNPVVIELVEFWFYVHAHGTESCKILGTFDPLLISQLSMTWGPCTTQ